MVMAPKESQPRNLRVHLRGNRFTLGKAVPRGVLQVIAGRRSAGAGPGNPVDPNQLSSGRLELARWIASPENPLTARVMVNRIWQHHFGRGLVATSDNFGTRGERPSHPELLDWLARRFVESGWSVKAMHRLMVLSSTYQQGGHAEPRRPAGRSRPAGGDRRSRGGGCRRRSSGTPCWPSAASSTASAGTSESGELLYEKAEDIKAKIRPNRLAADDPFYTRFKKRSVYLPVVRNMLPDVLALFDAADPNGVTAVRNDTTVASQSLFLLNSPFVREQARRFAERLLAAGELTDDDRIERAHLTAFGRLPTRRRDVRCPRFPRGLHERPGCAGSPGTGRSLCRRGRATASRSCARTSSCMWSEESMTTPPLSRRDWLLRSACGFGHLALLGLAAQDAGAATPDPGPPRSPLAPRPPHFPARAKRVVFLFMHGGDLARRHVRPQAEADGR